MTLDPVSRRALVMRMTSDKQSNTTTTVGIRNDTSVNGGLTDEAIGTIDCWPFWIVGVGTSNDLCRKLDRFIAHDMLAVLKGRLTLCRAAEGEILIREWSAIIPVHTAPISLSPEIGTTPDVGWLAISSDLAGRSMKLEHYRPNQEPE